MSDEAANYKATLMQDRHSAAYAMAPYTADPIVRQVLKTWGRDPEVEHQRRVWAEKQREAESHGSLHP